MTGKTAERAEAERLYARFRAAGAVPVEAAVLQPAETLLDLYGEDIRARAYVTQDPLRGELMLRPDFTVPVVQMHMAHGAAPARYTYAGEVFRQQEDDPDRPSEYLQVGYELFDGGDPAAADAEVFGLFLEELAPRGLRAATGDIGLLRAAVQGLTAPPRRKAALMRHLWRPRRFRALMDRFGGAIAERPPVATVAPWIGVRGRAEMAARQAALAEDAATPPIPKSERALIEALLAVRETLPHALSQLRDIAVDLPWIAAAVARFARRTEALAARGIDVEALDFEASYGRTAMEYYDGFVFGFYVEGRPDLPPVATGGRYDALTGVLGGGAAIPAVGAVIRPALLRHAAGGAR